MTTFKVRNDQGQEFDVDQAKLGEAEKDGFLTVVSNGKEEHRVGSADLHKAVADGYKPAQTLVPTADEESAMWAGADAKNEAHQKQKQYDNPLGLPEPIAGAINTFNDFGHGVQEGIPGSGIATKAANAVVSDDTAKKAQIQRYLEAKRSPVASTGGQIAGSIAAPNLGSIPGRIGMNVVDAATRADDLEGAVDNAELAGGVSAGIEALPYVGKAIGKGYNAVRGQAGNVARIASGIDAEAAMRQLNRPTQTAAAEADGFAHKLGEKVVEETKAKGAELGSAVGEAGENFLTKHGETTFKESAAISDDIDKFLTRHKPSAKGFSGITADQASELGQLSSMLKGGATGDDLYKLRDHLDHVERLAKKYDTEGTGPFINQLKKIRGQADGIIDKADKGFDEANKAYAQLAKDKGLLRGATNEGQSESMVNNLYGANKGAKQEAAGRLFTPESLDAAKDNAANKAFEKQGPAGSEMGLRNLTKMGLAIPTVGLAPALMAPSTWKHGLRAAGKVEQAVKNFATMPPQIQSILRQAFGKGPQQLAITHALLMKKDPNYKQAVGE